MKRYPQTLETIRLLAVFVVIVVLTALWHPVAYVIFGGFALYLVVESVRRDRKVNKRV